MAIVSPGAKLGDNVEVGPFAFIDADVEIGEGTKILNNATIYNHVKIGKDCTVFPGAVVGAIPQDLKFEGEESWVEIGDRVNIRECATINRGTKASGKALTKIGNDTLVMSCWGHMIEPVLINILDDCPCLNSLSLDGKNGTVTASVQNIESVHGLSRTKCFEDRIPALYRIFIGFLCKAFVIFFFILILRHIQLRI